MSNHKKLTSKQRVFKDLRAGETQTWIRIHRRIDKGLISRYATEFVECGLLYVVDPCSKVKLYRPTPLGVSFPVNQIKGEYRKLLPLGRRKPQSQSKKEGKIRHHRLSYKMQVKSPIGRKINWDKTNDGLNGITQHFLFFENITIRYQPSNKKGEYGEIVVWPTERKLTLEEFERHEDHLKKYLGHIYSWLINLLQCNLGIPEIYQKAEFGVPPSSMDLKAACKKNLRYGSCWTDKSTSDGEFETDDPEKAKAMQVLVWSDHNIPQRVANLEEAVDRMESSLDRITNSMDRLLSIFETPTMPDERRDVA